MLRDFNAFKFNPALGERNGTNGEESGWGRSETMYDGLRFLYRVCSFVHFTVSFQRSSEGRRVYSRGRESVPDQFPSLFFLRSSLSTSTSPSNRRRNVERPPGMGLSNVARLADVLHFISRWVFRFSDFYRPPRVQYACRFSRVFCISTMRRLSSNIHIFLLVFFFLLSCTISTFRRCPKKKRILL